MAEKTKSRDAPQRDADKRAFAFDSRENDSIADLVRRLTSETTELAHQQAELVKAEIRGSVTEIKEAAAEMAGAAVLGLAGVGVTLMGVAYLLGSAIPLWLATLIVGIAALVGAYAMFAAARSKLQSKSVTAERSRETLERTPQAVTGNTNKGRK